MPSHLLDTDIFSEIIKGRDATVLEQAASCRILGGYAISCITAMEIVKGLHKANREERIRLLMSQLKAIEVFPFDLQSSEIAGRIFGALEQSGQTIGFADPIIAAIAIVNNLTLVTGNHAHFSRIKRLGYSLRIENWREDVSS